jgi:hypothetical protein
MTLWSEFLSRIMLGASLSGPAVAAGADDAMASQPPAEVGAPTPDRQAEAAGGAAHSASQREG